MIVLLSPTKTFNKVNIYSHNKALFPSLTKNLVNKFSKFSIIDFKTNFKISTNLATKTFDYYQNFNNQYRAVATYGGTAFKHLDANTIAEDKLENLYILSALYGLLRANDAISKYRFEMQSTIFGSLYEYWNEPVNNYLMKISQNKTIYNLASNEYAKLLDYNNLNIITIGFANLDNGKLKSPSMMVKKQRGLMARALLLSNSLNVKNIVINGYSYSEKYSDNTKYMFIKGVSL